MLKEAIISTFDNFETQRTVYGLFKWGEDFNGFQASPARPSESECIKERTSEF
jgi:hypothetical protein